MLSQSKHNAEELRHMFGSMMTVTCGDQEEEAVKVRCGVAVVLHVSLGLHVDMPHCLHLMTCIHSCWHGGYNHVCTTMYSHADGLKPWPQPLLWL
jgi:hypothetical protein